MHVYLIGTSSRSIEVLWGQDQLRWMRMHTAHTAADTLMLMANDHFSKSKQPKTIMWTQMDIEAAEGLLMFLGDTVEGEIKEVRDFDLKELPSMEEDT
nr:hypothetical protein [Tanacetum cinerariifolium]